jgi:hypothetical protein
VGGAVIKVRVTQPNARSVVAIGPALKFSVLRMTDASSSFVDPSFYLLQEDGSSRVILEDNSGDLKLENSP